MFKALTTRSVSKQKQQLTSLKNNAELFSWLYISCQTRDGDLEEFFRYENQTCPPSLSDAGRLCQGTKCDLLACLEEISDARSEAPTTTPVVLDGAAIVQMLKPAACKNFSEYTYEIFVPYMSTKLQSSSRLDLVWDSYLAESLKNSAKAKCGRGVSRCLVTDAVIPENWQSFLRVDANKTKLFQFLLKAFIQWFDIEDQQLVITNGRKSSASLYYCQM